MGLFSPRTFPEIMADQLAVLLANTPLNDVNFGSIWTTLIEASAQEDDEQYFQMLEIVRGYSLDTIFGEDLDDRAEEFSIERRVATRATTAVTLGDDAFDKIETGVYAGLSGPPAGSATVNGDSKTGFPTSGQIVIGRGTANVETVPYTSITDFTNYVRFNLGASLANDHGTDESIILAQGGDRLVPAGTIVKVPASDVTEEIIFTLDANATILNGEDELEGVPVTAADPGAQANVPVGAIQRFDSLPFATATVRNPSRVTNGLDDESDQELRDRIKSTIQSLSRGTPTAIKSGVLGLVSEEDNKRVVSVSLRDTTIPADVVKLFIDDGTGFIPTFEHVGVETIVTAATGGEKYPKITNFPLVKAFTETQADEPFNIPNLSTLFVEVNGVQETVIFVNSDFAAPGAATAQEVLRKINAVANTFEARVSSGGSRVRLFSRSNAEEEIRIAGGSANTALQFQTDTKFTAKLYLERNDEIRLLTKDGRTAAIESGATAAYDFSSGARHLSIVVDGKVRSVLKAWFDPATFAVPSLVTVDEIVSAIEEQCPGLLVEPSSSSTRFTLSSLTKRSAGSKIRVVSDFTHAFNEEASVNVNRAAEFKTNGSNVTLFATNSDYVHLGHSNVPFDSVFVALATPANVSIQPVFEFWNGSSWTAWGVEDGTDGFTASGHILFSPPLTWAKTTVEGVNAYWFRIQRTAGVLATPPIESRIRICGANEEFEFSETEVVGANSDYTMNRFVGQIELATPLAAGDKLLVGSTNTRPFAISGSSGNYSGLPTTVLSLYVDGALKTITFVSGDFSNPASATPAEVATAINDRVPGVTAEAVAAGTKVKIRSNTWDGGSLRIDGSGANSIFDFPTDLTEGYEAHAPALVSAVGPWTFDLDDSLIVIVDDNFSATFTVPFFKEAAAAAGATSTVFLDALLTATFPDDDQINGFHVVFKTGANAGQRRTITNYVAATGEITVGVAFGAAPAANDVFQILPNTLPQVLDFLANKQITLLTNKVEVDDAEQGFALQLASFNTGEDAAIAVSGGNANTKLLFAAEDRGVDGYRHFTGLLQQVQWTVDGREDDQETYPGIRAAGVQIEGLEAVTVPISVSIEVTTREGVSLSGIVSSIKSAVSNYINRLAVGEDVILSEIVVAVKGVTGVFDAVMQSPVVNVAIADNEQARISDSNIGVV